jgi:D-serine deaminase-like pyridoxal phosphate-dependent protein
MSLPTDDQALHAHLIGRQGGRADLNSPALVVEIDVLDANIAAMAAFAAGHGLALRPHAKTHKSADIALRQMAAGAVGVCVAKLGEAEALAAGGVPSIHITSPVVSAPAIARLIALRSVLPAVTVVVDHPDNVAALSGAGFTTPLGVLIDIDPGFHRTGVASPQDAVAVARAIGASPALRYAGVQFYCGSEQHVPAAQARREAMIERNAILVATIEALGVAGFAPAIVTGGGTGTFALDAEFGLLTELQVGSYIFMDEDYLACEPLAGAPTFAPSLFVDTRVVSANSERLVTVDGGVKSFSTDVKARPRVVAGAPPDAAYVPMGDEHGALLMPEGAERPALGSVVTFTAPHCDPTVNLYDHYHLVRGDTLVDIWPVSGRGRAR